jgi:hypothetical protein
MAYVPFDLGSHHVCSAIASIIVCPCGFVKRARHIPSKKSLTDILCRDIIINETDPVQLLNKLQFIGQGSALDPLKGLLKKSLKNPQNFQ